MISTCESNRAEIDALRERCAACQTPGARARWTMLGRLTLGQAVALPVTEEAGGEFTVFTLGQRLTPHVRHRQKYVDVPVTEGRAFVFAPDGGGAQRVRTLREFVDVLEHARPGVLDPFIRRGDFSRWIGDVFGDYALAEELRRQEHRYRGGLDADTVPEMAGAVRARYDLTDDGPPAAAA
jgi:hypothetical protein